jgi:RNA polymerase sigma factor (sigma-70 family)
MRLGRRRPGRAPSPKVESERMVVGAGSDDADKARRFRDAALPHLDAVYTLARYLLQSTADAEDAVQDCYLRAFRHFNTFRGSAIKPWLMAILRNVCRAEYARRSARGDADADPSAGEEAVPLWQEAEVTPEAQLLRQWDAQTIGRLLAALPEPFREAIVLREINDLAYRDIAEIVGAPVGTVMSRLARGRALLREAWRAAENEERST